MDASWISVAGDFINRVGFPVAVALTLIFGVWSVVRWLRPWGEKLFISHIEFTSSLADTQRKQAANQSDTIRVLDEIQGMHKSGRKALNHIAEAIQEAAPENKRDAVRSHVQQAHQALNDS